MAKFTFTGLDSIQYQLQARGAKVSGTVNHMLHAGAKIAREEMQAALKEYEIRDTGDLIKSIKASKIKKGDSGKYITIRPTGYDRHGVPNALKGYVYEIGTSRLPARPWKTLADVRMRDKIQARMREVFQEEMSKNGGNEGKWNVEEETMRQNSLILKIQKMLQFRQIDEGLARVARQIDQRRAEIIGGGNAFSAWSGNAYSNDIFRSAVDAIARNAAKLKGSHIIKYRDHEQVTGDCKLNRMLQVEPNPYMSAFDMLYKLFTHYFLYNNAFAYIQKDERGQCVAVFPLNPVHAEFLSDTGGALYVRFIFSGGREVILPYADIVHLRRNFNGNDILGDPNDALSPALQLAHAQNEGIVSAIKTGASIRGILKRTQLANADILKEMRENFIQDYLNINNNGGIAVLDSAAEYIPIDNKPYAIDEKQMQAVKTKIYDYLGVSEAIVNSSYDENQWAAFYESVIEPLALQLSLEFTRKLFNDRERAFGNSILFESGRLQFTSNATKVNLIREIMPMGLLTVNQALEILNLPSVSGGDRRIQSLNYVDADKAEEYQLAKAKAPAALNGDTGAGADGKNGENGGTQA